MPVPRDPSLAITPLPGSPRERLETAHALGARAVVLDVTLPGLRPRELDRSARRGLFALLRRLELRLDGVDLPIPPAHFTDPARQDRAISVVAETAVFLAEASSLAETTRIVHLAAPDPHAAAAAAETDTFLTAPSAEALPPPYLPALDLAELAAGPNDPLEVIAATPGLGALRLADSRAGSRCPLGEGALDVGAVYAVVSTTAPGASLVIDPRQLPDARAGAGRSLRAWADAARPLF